MKLETVLPLATTVLAALQPFCERIIIAGSIRRQCYEIGDIEIVCIPRKRFSKGDLFGGSVETRIKEFGEAVRALGKVVKGSPDFGKAMQLELPDGNQVDIFTAREENWGYILAIRTGSAEFSKLLALRWLDRGYHGNDGMLMLGKNDVPIYKEEELFNRIGLPFIEPIDRTATNYHAIKKQLITNHKW